MLLLLVVAACDPDLGEAPVLDIETNNTVTIACADPTYPAEDGVVPYRAGGAFEVSVKFPSAQFNSGTRATVEIVTSDLVAGATLTSTGTLDDDGAGNLAGTFALAWPRGGAFTYVVGVAGTRTTVPACLELPDLALTQAGSVNNGAQTTVAACLDSSTSDGTVGVRLDGGTFKDGAMETSLPLSSGACDGSEAPSDNPRSHAKFTVIAKQAALDVLATIPNAGAARSFSLDITPVAPLQLALMGPSTAAPLSIVTLEVAATRDGAAAAGIDVAFDATPAVIFVPAMATTDDGGIATVRFQKPEAGAVYVRARAGATSADRIIN